MRAGQYLDSIRTVVRTFGRDADDFVFIGSCALGLYARPEGGPFRQTVDADVVSTAKPWATQGQRLADLCSREILEPDQKILCRYHIKDTGVAVDVLSPEGKNVGHVTEWFLRSVARAETFLLDGKPIRAVTPPYFMALKLEAWVDRGTDPCSDKDAEDLVAVATEVPDLAEQVNRENIGAAVRDLWNAAFAKHHLTADDVPEIVSWHLHPLDAAEEPRVVASLRRIASGC